MSCYVRVILSSTRVLSNVESVNSNTLARCTVTRLCNRILSDTFLNSSYVIVANINEFTYPNDSNVFSVSLVLFLTIFVHIYHYIIFLHFFKSNNVFQKRVLIIVNGSWQLYITFCIFSQNTLDNFKKCDTILLSATFRVSVSNTKSCLCVYI